MMLMNPEMLKKALLMMRDHNNTGPTNFEIADKFSKALNGFAEGDYFTIKKAGEESYDGETIHGLYYVINKRRSSGSRSKLSRRESEDDERLRFKKPPRVQ